VSKNTTEIKAAVVREKGGPFNVETLTLCVIIVGEHVFL
jgi:aryl-alcohol dehydrogenase